MTEQIYDDPYFKAIFFATPSTLAKNSVGGLFYKDSFATSRSSVSTACKIHAPMLMVLLAIAQVPNLSQVKRALVAANSIWNLTYDIDVEAKGIKIMLKLVSDSNRNYKTGDRTQQWLKELIEAHRKAPKNSKEDDTVLLPSPSPSPRGRQPSLGHRIN